LQEKQGGRQAHYKLTSTIMLWLQTSKATSGLMNLGGSLTRQHEADHPVNEANTHLANIGRMVEECESKIRATLNEIYFGKTKQIVSDLRSIDNLAELDKRGKFVDDLKRELIKQRQTSKDDN
jgi:capping protein beta